MKERPILMSGPMVRAILDGRKTQTRRVVKPQPERFGPHGGWSLPGYSASHDVAFRHGAPIFKAPYKPEWRLWVRETWRPDIYDDSTHYAASHPCPDIVKWHPSIHMPRSRSRITIEVTRVRVERLHDISEADAMAEGIEHSTLNDPRVEYRWLWESIHGAGSWDANPWLWVVEFKRAGAMGDVE